MLSCAQKLCVLMGTVSVMREQSFMLSREGFTERTDTPTVSHDILTVRRDEFEKKSNQTVSRNGIASPRCKITCRFTGISLAPSSPFKTLLMQW